MTINKRNKLAYNGSNMAMARGSWGNRARRSVKRSYAAARDRMQAPESP